MNLPQKIKNLYELQKLEIEVPFFVVIDQDVYKNIEKEIEKIKQEFISRNIKSVIIRSAGTVEDLENKSQAGFFESSHEIEINELDVEKIKYFWEKNKNKAKQTNFPEISLFIQKFFKSDLSGVAFTQDPYDENKSVFFLSAESMAITEGLLPEEKIFYFKKENRWEDKKRLTDDIKKNLEKIIEKAEKIFPNGADMELGINNDVINVYQIRPITRNENEKILLKEKKRLEGKFGSFFGEQQWGRNGFVYALGDLSPLSLSFYNYLLLSDELKNILEKYKALDELNKENKFNLLENIGGRTYFNFTQEKNIFIKKNGWWKNFKRIVLFLSLEDSAREENKENMEKDISLESSFSWLFLSGVFFQFFLEQEKRKYKNEVFIERLKNTEIFCDAGEPKPETIDDEGLGKFISQYYYLSDYPYELSSRGLIDEDKSKVFHKYKHFKKKEKKIISEQDVFDEKTRYWLKAKTFWRQTFLKKLFDHKKYLIEKYGEDIFNANNWAEIIKKEEAPNKISGFFGEKISEIYSEISGKFFPFSEKSIVGEDFIIVPGDIDFKNLVFVKNEDEDYKNYLNKFIAITVFPSDWIPYIPDFKGIVLKEGNELSHMAITCREYNIPCVVRKEVFK